MRAAMAAAEVGDDVYGEDPTVNLLERRAAEIFGREAALFVPTGTMGNQIAIRALTQPGQEVIAESRAHILDYEMATTAVFSGCLIRAVPAEGGILTWKHIEPAISPFGAFRAATGLIEIENTANLAGGVCTPVEVLEEIWAGAKAHKLPTHLDGARIFNAAVALGCGCEGADARLRHGDVLPVERIGRAGGIDAGWFCGVDGASARLPQGFRRRNEAGGCAGRGGTDRARRRTETSRRRPRQRPVAGRSAGAY